MKTIILLLFAALISPSGLSQTGYFGRRNAIQFGTATNVPIFRPFPFLNSRLDTDLLLPKLTFGYHRETKKGRVFHLESAYQQLPNSHFVFKTGTNTDGQYVHNLIDSVFTKSDNLKLGFGVRYFKRLPQLENYVEIHAASNFVFNHSIHLFTDRTEYPTDNYYTQTNSTTTLKRMVMVPQFSLLIGSNFPLKEKSILDFGVRLSIISGKFTDKNGDGLSLPDEEVYHKIMSSKKLFSTNTLEAYVSILLF